ncbi:hypothetical protein BC830DRAFT_1233172 [Chytriomyces sp. MP71]|nr:hypothetical protein BC830DRAFT_1233172 [Chytriomyces sp. MP71]
MADHDEAKRSPRVCGIEWTKRKIIGAIATVVLVIVITVLLVVFVIGPKIAQSSIDGSSLTLTSSSITGATNNSFLLQSTGNVGNAGGLAATLNFPQPVTVSWTNREKGAADLPLGTVQLSPISVSGGNGAVSLNTTFSVTNVDAMTQFSSYMINNGNFSWRLTGPASATAMGLTFNNLNMDKVVTLSGFNGLSGVTVLSFDASAGNGNNVNVSVTTQLVNPSSITMQLGTAFFNFVMGTGVGTMSANNVTIVPGNNTLSMTGVLLPASMSNTTNAVAATVSSLNERFQALFANAVNNVVPVQVTGDHTSQPANWLNTAFKAMTLSVSMNLTKIAQDSVSGAELTLDTSSISNITETSFQLAGSGSAKNAGFMDATLSFSKPVTVAWASGNGDVVLGTLNLSPVSVSGPTPKSGKVAVDSQFSLTNQDGMAQFAAYMINNGQFTWKLSGTAEAEAYGLKFTNLKLAKSISMSGFNGLAGVKITSFDLPASDPTTGIHIVTGSTIANPSTISMNMGDVGFLIKNPDGYTIGNLKASDMKIVPGDNSYTLNGAMKVADQAILSDLMDKFLNGAGMDATIVGDTGATSWLTTALKSMQLKAHVDSPVLTVPIVSGIKIPSMAVDMIVADTTGNSVLVNSPGMTALFQVPYTFPINVQQASQSLYFVDPSSGTQFATFVTDMQAASADQTSHILTTSVVGGHLKAVPGQEGAFAAFMKELTFVSTASVNIVGNATSIASTDAGVAQISLPLKDSLALTGFQGFQNIQILSTKVVGGDAKAGVHLQVSLILNNPSTLSLSTHVDVTMDLLMPMPGGAAPVKVGTAIMPNMQVVPGPNAVLSDCYVVADPSNPVSVAVVTKLMSAFISGGNTAMIIAGSTNSIIYDSLKPAFSELRIPATIQGPAEGKRLVLGSTAHPVGRSDGGFEMHVDFNIVNPLDTPYTLLNIKADVTSGDVAVGKIDFKLDPPFTVPPHSNATTPLTTLIQTPAQYAQVFNLFLGALGAGKPGLLVNATQTLTASIGGYISPVELFSTDILVTLGA